MAFGVFLHRTDSAYKDVPSEQYQFPKPYINMFFALIEKGSYLDFGDPVQFRNHDEIVERPSE